MSKIGFICSTSDWLLNMLKIRNGLSVKLEVPRYMNWPKQFRNSFAGTEFENPMTPAT